MNKLGFSIKLSSEGVSTPLECNAQEGAWAKKVVDIRQYIKLFDNLLGTSNSVTFLSLEEDGCFIVQLKAIQERKDFLSGWLYIPNALKISNEDVIKSLNFVKGVLELSSISKTEEDEIKTFFSKEYDTKKVSFKNIPSSGDKFGVRYVGHYSLEEIVGVDRCQQYYSNYRAVFILDENQEVKISKDFYPSFTDLTKSSMDKYCILLPPTKETLKPFGFDAHIVDTNNQEFKDPKLVKKGSQVQLYAVRNGFNAITIHPFNVYEEEQEFPLFSNIVWMKDITSSMFVVQTSDGKKLNNPTIHIGGYTLNAYNKITLSEKDCRWVDVKISGTDCKEKTIQVNLLQDQIKVILERQEKSWTGKVRLSNNKLAEISITSKYLNHNSGDCPLKGYCYSGYEQTVEFDPLYNWKQRGIGFLMCIALILCYVGYVAGSEWLDTHEFALDFPPFKEIKKTTGDNSQQGNGPYENEESNDSVNVLLIAYLDNKNIWHKDSLERYTETRGLFDALNNFELEQIKNFEEQLQRSNKFNDLLMAIEEAQNTNKNPKQGKENNNGKYNTSSDKGINIDNYISWIKAEHVPVVQTQPVQSASGTKEPSKIKEGSKKSSKAPQKTTSGNKGDDKTKSKRGGES